MFQFGRALHKVKGNYDAVHMLFLHVGYSPWINRIRKLSPRFIVSVFGSDFYQSPPIIRIVLKRIVKKVDLLTAANPKTRADFIQFYGIKEDRMRLCRFGLSPLDSINKLSGITREQAKEQLGFTPKSQVVVCGYNASPLQQHEELIASLRNMAQPYRENVLFVFPIASNAGQERKEKLKNLLALSNLQFKTIDHFLNDEDLAKLRIAADVMIQVQKTDQLSGSMQEHVFAGSVVITGHWLPYAIFEENGIYFRKVNSVAECGRVLAETLDHLPDFQRKSAANREKIWSLSSWKSNIENWLSLYEK